MSVNVTYKHWAVSNYKAKRIPYKIPKNVVFSYSVCVYTFVENDV